MTDKTEKTIKAKFLRDVTDAGTGARYYKDEEHPLPEGVFKNYAAFGGVEAIKAKAADDKPAAN